MRPDIYITSTYTDLQNIPDGLVFFTFSDLKQWEKELPLEWRPVFIQKAKQELFEGKQGQIIHVETVVEKRLIYVFCVGLGKRTDLTPRIIRDQTGTVSRLCRENKITSLYIETSLFHHLSYELTYQTLSEGVLLGNYAFEQFKSEEEKKKKPQLKSIYIQAYGKEKKLIEKYIQKGIQTSVAVCLSRDLVNTPASHAHPQTMVRRAKEIADMSKKSVKVSVLDESECKTLGMEAFLGVAKGSEHKPAFIVLRYISPGNSLSNKKKKIVLIGKTVTFDSGGLSLKPSDAMMDMKIDMAGGAAVLGIFHYLAAQRPTLSFSEVVGILPACENMPSGRAMRPGDIVKAMNGKTIEVLNTDAEGRLTLADALSYAEKKEKADIIIDLATLTGACMVALGADLSGLFSNSSQLTEAFKKSAQFAGDDLWELPLYTEYSDKTKSIVADLKNVGGGRYAGAITAALFLKEFVTTAQWIHIDIAGPAYREEKPRGVLPKGATGWGVLSIIHFLEQTYSL